MELNHCANRVSRSAFNFVIKLFVEQLDFVVLRRTTGSVWIRQRGRNVNLQFSPTDTLPDRKDKDSSHVVFLSTQPQADLKQIALWIEEHGYRAIVGGWSATEFYLDVPDVFVDFVIEAMMPEMADYGI